MSKRARKALAAYRKAALTASEHTYADLARVADVTYSMADKWVNARRGGVDCARAFQSLTGKPAMPGVEAAQKQTNSRDAFDASAVLTNEA